MMSKEMIKFDLISKNYFKKPVLDKVTFNIQAGEVFGYIGPNGAGKTTTIKILTGLISDFSGKLRVDNLNLPRQKGELTRIIGYMPQDIAFQDWRTVEHVLFTFGRLSGLDKSTLQKRMTEVLRLVGLDGERKKKVIHLSGGMNQKLGLAQALLHNPRILVLDEPLSGLDPGSRISLKQVIRNLKEQGITVFFSSHILSDVEDIADRIGVLHQGRLLVTQTLEQLKNTYSMVDDICITLYNGDGINIELFKVSGVNNIKSITNQTFRVFFDSASIVQEALHLILKSLVAKGYRVKSIIPQSASLDELFLRIIQKEVA